MYKILMILLSIIFMSCQNNKVAGTGTQTGNAISGVVFYRSGGPSINAKVILSTIEEDGIFDTVQTDSDGKFNFSDTKEGEYAIIALNGDQSGINKVLHLSDKDSWTTILLDDPISLRVNLDSISKSDSLFMVEMKVMGTNYSSTLDSADNLILSNIPSGDMVVVLYDRNGEEYELEYLSTKGNCTAYLIVDPALSPEEWLVEGCGAKDPLGKPYISWMSPPDGSVGAIARLHRNSTYDMAIQFSHPMNTRLTNLALSACASDSLVKIKTITWQGADLVYIRFGKKTHIAGTYFDFIKNYSVGVTYSVVIDTIAETAFGIRYAMPETLSFSPEPYPRLTSVIGFQFMATASYEVVDSLPDSISLGNSVSPSIAMIDNNKLLIHTIGNIDTASMKSGIHFYENGLSINIDSIFGGNPFRLRLLDLLKSSSNYSVVFDTNLTFNNGIRFPKQQTIYFSTTPFTIDTALLLGSYIINDTVSIDHYRPNYYFSQIIPNLPYTTFYASTILDPLSVADNVIINGDLDNEELIIEGHKFGWKASGWLPPGKCFEFTILPGLKSAAGDTLGDTLRYKIYTESFNIDEFPLKSYFNKSVYFLRFLRFWCQKFKKSQNCINNQFICVRNIVNHINFS